MTSTAPELQFRKANFLDIPLIFNLFLEGSIDGAFAERYLVGAGHLKLLMWIVKALCKSPRRPRTNTAHTQLHVLHRGAQDLGFAQIQHSMELDGGTTVTLTLLAIAKEHQNQRFGTWAVATIIREMPAGALLEVYCTKYSRSMQRLLHTQRFTRDKIIVSNLSRFSFRKPE